MTVPTTLAEAAALALEGRRALHDLHLGADRLGLAYNLRLTIVAGLDLATDVHGELAKLAGERP